MHLTAVTYRRRLDDTRIVYVLPFSPPTAQLAATVLAPEDFELVAVKELDGTRMDVPPDAEHWDRYGQHSTDEQRRQWSADFGRSIERVNN